MSSYSMAQIEDIEEISDGRCPMRPVRHHFGITSFGINAWTGDDPGDRIINEHDEQDAGEEELYLVHSGRARFEIDGRDVDAPAGSFVFVPMAVKRTAFAEEAGTTIIAMGGTPGEAYRPAGWEIWMPLGELYQDGRYDEAADRGRPLAQAHPEYPVLLYNVACCESLAGRTADAVEDVRLALERGPHLRKLAAEDTDLDPIRSEPTFQQLLA